MLCGNIQCTLTTVVSVSISGNIHQIMEMSWYMAFLLMMGSSQQNSAIALVTSENYCQEFKATDAMSSYLPHSFVF